MIVGEAWGANEEREKKPFVGASGNIFTGILSDAGIPRNSTFMTNVVCAQPRNNEFTEFLIPTKEGKGKNDAFLRGLYPRQILLDGLEKLKQQINLIQPKVIIATGAYALWALTEHGEPRTVRGYKVPGGIMKWRGSQTYTTAEFGSIPCLPIIHPAAIMREWKLRQVTVHDLRTRIGRFLQDETSWIEPSYEFHYKDLSLDFILELLQQWYDESIVSSLKLSVDIETIGRKSVACLGLADASTALCIPFTIMQDGEFINTWTLEEEENIWYFLRRLLELPSTYIIGQNYTYDYQFLNRTNQIKAEANFDTMVAHHLLWPSTPKALHNLAALYCDHYCYWKDESEEWALKELGHEDLWRYNCKDVRATYEIYEALQKQIEARDYQDHFDFQMQQWSAANAMMLSGINYDVEARKKLAKETGKTKWKLEKFLVDCMPEDLQYTEAGGYWFKSPKMTAEIFYDILQVQEVKDKKSGSRTTNTAALTTLKKRVPWLKTMLEALEIYRSLGIYTSTFLEVKLSPLDRLHCNFNISGTDTFRWSSSANGFGEGGNLQNVPKGDEED